MKWKNENATLCCSFDRLFASLFFPFLRGFATKECEEALVGAGKGLGILRICTCWPQSDVMVVVVVSQSARPSRGLANTGRESMTHTQREQEANHDQRKSKCRVSSTAHESQKGQRGREKGKKDRLCKWESETFGERQTSKGLHISEPACVVEVNKSWYGMQGGCNATRVVAPRAQRTRQGSVKSQVAF